MERLRVVVPDDQLSLAIGKEGQNARLAARLTGWKIDIKSETQMAALVLSGEAWEERSPKTTKEDERTCGRGGNLAPKLATFL